MGLYLYIFDGEEEINGVEAGSYNDYGVLLDYVALELERGKAGARFPTFVLKSDSDGEWSVADCKKLQVELDEIAVALRVRRAVAFTSDWQRDVAKSIGLKPQNALESFIDVDGEFLLERLQSLVKDALARQLPILFQ